MVSIRNKGDCPCPRCKIRLSNVHLVGTTQDRNDREKLARKDDVNRQWAVKRSREAIYREPGKTKLKPVIVNGVFVESRLKGDSLVPTLVCSGLPPPILPYLN